MQHQLQLLLLQLLAPLLLLQLLLQPQPASKIPTENKKAAAKRLFLRPNPGSQLT
jgi:hypothetical protein